MNFFDNLFVILTCPNCNYGMDVEMLSIRLQATIFCPCCKVIIQLFDADGSAHNSQEKFNSAVKDLENQIEKLSTTIQIKL